MHRRLCLLGAFFLFIASVGSYAEDPPLTEVPPGLRDRALIIDINTRLLEKNHVIVWNEVNQRITFSGSPVPVKLEGDNVVIALEFTPFIRSQGGNVLVIKSQVLIKIPDEEGVRYNGSIQQISIDLDKPIIFLPLGPARPEDGASIEIILTVKSYREAEGTPVDARRGNGR